jgi:hypothetical protein
MQEPYEHAVAKAQGPNARRALEYSCVMHRLVEQAKDPAFGAADWAPLATLVDTARFRRVGNFMETVDWAQYEQLLTMWGKGTEWEFDIRRVTEGERHAIIEMHERARYPDRSDAYNSVSVYEFGEDGRIVHLDIYLQIKPPPAAGQSPTWDLGQVGAG